VGTTVIGAQRSIEVEKMLQKTGELEKVTIDMKTALLFPLVGSTVLLFFFYFFNVISFLVFVSTMFTTIFAVSFTLFPSLIYFFPSSHSIKVYVPCFGIQPLSNVVSSLISVLLLLSWIRTGSWIFNNLIGLSFCVVMISFIRLPSLKVGFAALVALFFYDIFWVFFSEYFFGDNVMVKVATTEADNPVNSVASRIGINVVQSIQLPMKVIWGHHMLGLGDMVLPGILMAFAAKFDTYKNRISQGDEDNSMWWKESYFFSVSVGYSAGLFATLIAVTVFKVAQPALLYLVPAILVPFVVQAYVRNELSLLWNGFPALAMKTHVQESDSELV